MMGASHRVVAGGGSLASSTPSPPVALAPNQTRNWRHQGLSLIYPLLPHCWPLRDSALGQVEKGKAASDRCVPSAPNSGKVRDLHDDPKRTDFLTGSDAGSQQLLHGLQPRELSKVHLASTSGYLGHSMEPLRSLHPCATPDPPSMVCPPPPPTSGPLDLPGWSKLYCPFKALAFWSVVRTL